MYHVYLNIGGVFIFEHTGGIWSEKAFMQPTSSTKKFGVDVNVYASQMVVGSEDGQCVWL